MAAPEQRHADDDDHHRRGARFPFFFGLNFLLAILFSLFTKLVCYGAGSEQDRRLDGQPFGQAFWTAS